MSKFKGQIKSKCLNDKTYPVHLSAPGTDERAMHRGVDFASIWSFDMISEKFAAPLTASFRYYTTRLNIFSISGYVR